MFQTRNKSMNFSFCRFSKVKVGSLGGRVVNKQSSMHTASEFDSGLAPLDHTSKKKKKY